MVAYFDGLGTSGAYYIAMAADRVIAHPTAITGSIGVVMVKPLTVGFWEKLGVTWDEVHSSSNARMWSGTHDYTEAEWERVQTWLDRVYEDFTAKVAEGRGLSRDAVHEVARGRIWSGQDAHALGLVDELGGYPASLRLARDALDLAPDASLQLRPFPRPLTRTAAILARLSGRSSESSEDRGVELLSQLMRAVQPAARWVSAAGLAGQRGVLQMHEVPGAF